MRHPYGGGGVDPLTCGGLNLFGRRVAESKRYIKEVLKG